MKPQGRWHRVLGLWLLAAGLLGGSGCMSFLHPIDGPPADHVTCCKPAPACCRNHVYVFLIHGLDPLDYANLTGVRDYIQAQGFHKTYFGQLYHTFHFEKEIHRIHQEDPGARFVLIGFSFGANMVRYLANSAHDCGIPVDLLVYLGGNTLHNEARDQPENCAYIVNILACGCIWNGVWMDRAENIYEPDVHHFGSPTHPHTLEVLARELAVIAENAQAAEPAPPAEPGAPPPAAEPGEWDFLKPVAHLGTKAGSRPPPP
jgi:hypothetical protein